MAAENKGDPPVSPWVYDSGDYQDNHIAFTVNFNEQTHAILSARIDRDPGCMYTKIYIGVGEDGSPNNSVRVFSAGQATGHPIPAAQLSAVGIDTLEDLFQYQITAGP